MTLKVQPITIKQAALYVAKLHRHLKKIRGGLWATSVVDENGTVRGVAIVGNPARLAMDGWTCEVLRCATDGAPNACTLLYSTCRRAAQTLGYKRCLTKTRIDEPGTSLLALGIEPIGKTRGGEHSRVGRPRAAAVDPRPKIQWDLLQDFQRRAG